MTKSQPACTGQLRIFWILFLAALGLCAGSVAAEEKAAMPASTLRPKDDANLFKPDAEITKIKEAADLLINLEDQRRHNLIEDGEFESRKHDLYDFILYNMYGYKQYYSFCGLKDGRPYYGQACPRPYRQNLALALAQAWHTGKGPVVTITIFREAEPLVSIIKTSGDKEVDNSAKKALESSSIPPLPKWYKGQGITFSVDTAKLSATGSLTDVFVKDKAD